MTAAEWYAFAERVREEAWPCKHGHPTCSDRDGGPCLCEEEFSTFGGCEDDHADCLRCKGGDTYGEDE
jgi:hypothetical protein